MNGISLRKVAVYIQVTIGRGQVCRYREVEGGSIYQTTYSIFQMNEGGRVYSSSYNLFLVYDEFSGTYCWLKAPLYVHVHVLLPPSLIGIHSGTTLCSCASMFFTRQTSVLALYQWLRFLSSPLQRDVEGWLLVRSRG